MGSKGLETGRVYRVLLKSVRKHIGKEEKKRHFTDFITQEFRKTTDDSAIPQKLKLARDYNYLLNNVLHHKELLYSYGIAVDRSDEVARTLRKAAASVGLQLPEVYRA
ncbi:hypothetical protein GIB67_038176 [Kingdonia uniflora]|uniref:Uncharacterized protein n=1 Tax=Kingdonia uniflora TaxID=39325 RepID=A0A7J7MR91_9MAGN|nr:hypothetical protein GIB67_004341 [Kingdonia uniflora]KAF6166316.1 hypothetical protein GIB67_038176 [Kingdonia uniflora]